ncbi:SDR family oxidoreductase [Qaidamihabitans albus]|uniref:SDR family oxidoreductase n=1 Tax=Qaidamihabitans albus TaxID=2795733 RepID=UPI0018F2411E|nr:SDR family NAD(P)-dependent oxidoreductase [Qaidamihabitans albus]
MKVALVTGATKNIGFAAAERLARDGHVVAVNGRDPDAVARAVARLRGFGARAEGFPADVADERAMAAMFDRIESALGPVVILVNNAGLRCHGPLIDTQLEDWSRVLDVVLTGAFLATRRALPGMIEAGWGRIVNVAGVSGQSGAPGRVAVVTAKSGMIGLTKATALEAAPHGVTVNAISPGFIDTDRSQSLGDNHAAAAHYARGRQVPVGRAGVPEDVAELCGYLCSDAAGYVTGQTLGVNGGTYM